MPVILFANTKGGCGKSTCSLIAATELARQGATVRIIDTDDPQYTNGTWADGSESAYRELVVLAPAGTKLPQLIDTLKTQVQFVLIDVQGSGNMEIVNSMSRADFVVVPMQAKTADSQSASRAVELIAQNEMIFNKRIPYSILLTRNSPALTTREEKSILAEIAKNNLPKFKTSVNERTAFSHMYAFKLALDELNNKETSRLEEAQENAFEFVSELIDYLR